MARQQFRIFFAGFLYFLLALSGPLWGQWPRTHQDDIVELTLRHQSGIRLDFVLSQAIGHHLAIARTVLDTLEGIHTFPRYGPSQLVVWPSGTWADTSWLQNRVTTGDAYLDSLGSAYGLIQIDGTGRDGIAILHFAAPLELGRLGELYAASSLISKAGPNFIVGDGDDIQLTRLDSVWDFIFSIGRGDCPAGCIFRHFWYIEVQAEGGNLLLEVDRNFTEPIIFPWNIPPRYAVTMFAGADTLISAITNAPQWWVRRHAIEASWRLAVRSEPWVGEDLDPQDQNAHWHILKSQILDRLGELQSAYSLALDDPKPM